MHTNIVHINITAHLILLFFVQSHARYCSCPHLYYSLNINLTYHILRCLSIFLYLAAKKIGSSFDHIYILRKTIYK